MSEFKRVSEPQDRERAAFEAYCKTLSVWKQAEIPAELCYEFWQAACHEERKRTLEEARTRVLEQRCERGTPYDMGVMAAANAIAALEGEGNG